MIINCPQKADDSDYTSFKFPAGELHLQLSEKLLKADYVDIRYDFLAGGNESIIELWFLCDTLSGNNIYYRNLYLPYCPFGQADRVNQPGECFSSKIFYQYFINRLGFSKIVITDPHSDVVPALLDKCEIIPQHEVMFPLLKDRSNYILVSPDAGAYKKVFKLATILQRQVVTCEKVRNVYTGEITDVVVHCQDFHGMDAIIVDDMCVGGKTFVEIAKLIRQRNAGKIILMTTNGVYSKGLQVFDGLIDEIYNQYERVK